MTNPLIISTGAYDGYDFATAFSEIAALGVSLVEVAFIEGYTTPFTEDIFTRGYAAELLELLKANELDCHSFSAHMDLGKTDAVATFSRRMEFAKALGAKFIVSNAAREDKRDQFMLNIKELAQLGEQLEMQIGLENPGDGNANLIDTGAKGLSIIREINSPAVGINYDPGNMISHCFEKVRPEEDFRAALEHIIHFHVKDVQADDNGFHFTEIGKGDIDYTAILREVIDQERIIPLSLEIPLRLRRGKDAAPHKSQQPVALEVIRPVMQGSVTFMHNLLKVAAT